MVGSRGKENSSSFYRTQNCDWRPRLSALPRWSQVRELDTFAGSMSAKKKACLDQIDKDRQELAYVDSQINSETKKYVPHPCTRYIMRSTLNEACAPGMQVYASIHSMVGMTHNAFQANIKPCRPNVCHLPPLHDGNARQSRTMATCAPLRSAPMYNYRYNALLENLNARRAERDRMRQHLARCKGDNALVSTPITTHIPCRETIFCRVGDTHSIHRNRIRMGGAQPHTSAWFSIRVCLSDA